MRDNFPIGNVRFSDLFRAMGIIATYIDGEDKDAIVSSATTASSTTPVHSIRQRQFQSLLPPLMNVIGQCLDNGDSSGTSTLMDIYETLLVLVSRVPLLSTSIRYKRTRRKPHYSADIFLTLFNSFWDAVEIAIMIPICGYLP